MINNTSILEPLKSSYAIVLAKCNISGENSLFVDGVQGGENSGTFDGRLIAHDILEHCQGVHKIGGVIDEIRALGAVQYTRGVGGDISFGGYLSDIVEVALNTDYNFALVEKTSKAEIAYIPDMLELIEMCEIEFDGYGKENLNSFLVNVNEWIKQGHDMAEERFKNIPCVQSLFDNIASEVNEVQENNELWEGFTIDIDLDSGVVSSVVNGYDFDEEIY